MLIAVIVFGACQALVIGCSLFLVRRWYGNERQRLMEEAENALRSFVVAPDAETPSPMAAIVDQFALLLAARLVQQVKAMLAGVESGASKGEQLELMESAKAGSPWLSLIAGMLPKRLQRQLMANPQMVGALSKLAGGNNHQETDAIPQRRHRE
jgi:hypothetical protein